MKKYTLLLAGTVLLASFYACTKKNDDPTTTPVTTTPSIVYTVNGLSDMTIPRDTTVYLPINIAHSSGPQETVNVAITGLPAGMSISQSTFSGIPTFTTTLMLTASRVLPGTYQVTVTTSSASTSSKSFTFKITVIAPANCGSSMPGLWTGYNGMTTFSAVISSPSTNTLIASKFISSVSATLHFNLNCDNDSVEVPQQTVWGITYDGKGTFNASRITLYIRNVNAATTSTVVYTK